MVATTQPKLGWGAVKPADLSASSAARLIYAASKAWDEDELLDEQAVVVLSIRGGTGSPPNENDSAISHRKVEEDAMRKKKKICPNWDDFSNRILGVFEIPTLFLTEQICKVMYKPTVEITRKLKQNQKSVHCIYFWGGLANNC